MAHQLVLLLLKPYTISATNATGTSNNTTFKVIVLAKPVNDVSMPSILVKYPNITGQTEASIKVEVSVDA